MVVEKNANLGVRTTMKIGGYAESLYIPETEEELIDITSKTYDEHGRVLILSGGSNLLINDEHRFEEVIYMGSACPEMIALGDGCFYIGASNRIQAVISFVNDNGFGGFEGLVGLPAMFGGIIYMNAGLGGAQKPLFTIGDFVERVRAYDLAKKTVVELSREECEFSHRSSAFHRHPYVILGAVIRCPERTPEHSNEIKEARKKYCRENFEYGKGCFGTCFSRASYKILKIVSIHDKIWRLGGGRVTFGKNNKNWIVNHGGGRYKDARRIINACIRAHKLCRKEVRCEVIIWE
ncbi:MAG: FAD-binding protein [Clostridia bacterium]|nr:FAD-binding protein [Clostridia bacterium]